MSKGEEEEEEKKRKKRASLHSKCREILLLISVRHTLKNEGEPFWKNFKTLLKIHLEIFNHQKF